MVILLFGPPGSGKGTQSVVITRRLRIPAISTGEMLRSFCSNGGQAHDACQLIARGTLVSDELVNEIVRMRIGEPDCRNGFLLDGYPRTIAQARFLGRLVAARDLPEPVVVHLDVPRPVLVERISSRRRCPECGRIYNLLYHAPRRDSLCDYDGVSLEVRDDDDPEVVERRLRAYDDLTGPLIEYYRGPNYYRIDGDREPPSISEEIESLLDARMIRVRALSSRGAV